MTNQGSPFFFSGVHQTVPIHEFDPSDQSKQIKQPFVSVYSPHLYFNIQYKSKSIDYSEWQLLGKLKCRKTSVITFGGKLKKKMCCLDHKKGTFKIQSSQPSEYSKSFEFKYQDVLECNVHPYSQELRKEKLMTVQKKWTFEFQIKVSQNIEDRLKIHTFIWYAVSQYEKDLWCHTFKWICECNYAMKQIKQGLLSLDEDRDQQYREKVIKMIQNPSVGEELKDLIRSSSESPDKLDEIPAVLVNEKVSQNI